MSAFRRLRTQLWLALLVALVATACQTPSTAHKPRRPESLAPEAFFWEAKAPEGGTLYLLGSVHIGDGRELALDPRIDGDWQTAQELVVELDLTAPSPIDAVEATNRYGLLPQPKTLQQVVRADTYKQVVEYMKQHEYSMDRVDQMRPWMVALVVQDLEYATAGLQPENGVDAVLLRRAKGKKPIVPLETLDEQMSTFAGLPDALQENWLTDVLRESQSLLAYTREMLRVWEAGDDAKMSELLFPAAETQPDELQFYDRMYWSRNRVMADRLAALAVDGKPRFVVVGTGHLLGARGIPELLAQRGFSVTRMGTARVVGGTVGAPATIPPPAGGGAPSPPTTAPSVAPAPAVAPPTPVAQPEQPAPTPSAPAAAPTVTVAPAAPAPAPTVTVAPVAPAAAPPGAVPPTPAPTAAPPTPVAPALAPTVAPEAVPAPAAPPAPRPARGPAAAGHDEWLGQDVQPAEAPAPPVTVPAPPAPAPTPAPQPKAARPAGTKPAPKTTAPKKAKTATKAAPKATTPAKAKPKATTPAKAKTKAASVSKAQPKAAAAAKSKTPAAKPKTSATTPAEKPASTTPKR